MVIWGLDLKLDSKQQEEHKDPRKKVSPKERSKRHRDRKRIYYQNLEKEHSQMKVEIANLKQENEKLKADLEMIRVSLESIRYFKA